MTDITQTRIESQARRVLRELAVVYERMPAVKPDFWARWDAAESALNTKVQKRPLTLTEIERAFNEFRKAAMEAM